MLTSDESSALFTLARASLDARLRGAPPPPLPAVLKGWTEARAVFVTLFKGEALRGCIGTTLAHEPLPQAVRAYAVRAGFHDPRFPPLSASELAELRLELSVLTPLERTTPEAIEVGVHGLQLRRGSQAGLLLPQVASERGWDPETFLEHTAIKAGLPKDAWREPDVELWSFRCELYHEA